MNTALKQIDMSALLERAIVCGRETNLAVVKPRGVRRTGIEWCDFSVNPIRAIDPVTRKVGWHCVKVSDGCKHCYAEAMNKRMGTGHAFTAQGAGQVELFLDPGVLQRLLVFKPKLPGGGPFVGGPRASVFLCSMCDLFDERVPSEWVDRIMQVVLHRLDIDFIVLTKRAERMKEYTRAVHKGRFVWRREWPFANVFFGVTCEDNRALLDRVPALVCSDIAHGWISYEPAGGDLGLGDTHLINSDVKIVGLVAGGESGSAGRPVDPDWIRSAQVDCKRRGVKFFFKQWGEWAPDNGTMRRVGKKHGGAVLDGNEYRELAWGGARE